MERDKLLFIRSLSCLSEKEIKRLRSTDMMTTGMIARLCRVAPRTVSKWVDTGMMRGHRIPGKTTRRVHKEEVIRFMKVNNIPLSELAGEFCDVMCLTNRYDIVRGLEEDLGPGWSVRKEPSLAMFILEMVKTVPIIVVLDWEQGNSDCQTVIEASSKLSLTPIIFGICSCDYKEEVLTLKGCKESFQWPLDRTELVCSIRKQYQGR